MTTTKAVTHNPLRCMVIDDEPVAIEGILLYIEKLDYLTISHTCVSAIDALEILKEKEIDLLFLDINMPYLTGLEFLESLDNPPLVILTTAYSEYALEGYKYNVVDYLLKPISFQRFFQASQKALEIHKQKYGKEKATDYMYIRQDDKFVRIVLRDILYVEGMQNYLKLHFADEVYIIHQTMSSLEETLPTDVFFRVHKSYLVNTTHIESIAGTRLFVGGTELPISRHRKEDLLNSVVYKNLISK